MNVSCEIIKDLMPLYHDGVCSQESKAMLEEHIASCESCRADLKEMDDALMLKEHEAELKVVDELKGLSKKWKLEMLKSLVKGVLYTVITIAVIALVLYLFVDIRTY